MVGKDTAMIKRLPVIRFIRYLYFSLRVRIFAYQCAMVGLGMGTPNQSDLDVLDAIRRGDR